MKLVAAKLLAVLLAYAAPAAAQENRPSLAGLAVGTHAVAVGSRQGESGTRHGGGAGVFLGFGVTRHVMVLLNTDLAAGAFRDDESTGALGHADLGARVAPFRFRRAFPYAQAAFSSALRETTADRHLTGAGWTIGGGLEVVLGSRASLDLALLRTWVRYDERSGPGTGEPADLRESTTRLVLGTVWRPPQRR